MKSDGLRHVPLSRVTYLRNGLVDVANYLREGTWKTDSKPALLLWRADAGSWYVFDLRKFRDLARRFVSQLNSGPGAKPWADLPRLHRQIQKFFNIHESTGRPEVPKGTAATSPAVEVENGKPVGVWIDAIRPDATLGGRPADARPPRSSARPTRRTVPSPPPRKKRAAWTMPPRSRTRSARPTRSEPATPTKPRRSVKDLPLGIRKMTETVSPGEAAGTKTSQPEVIRRTPHLDAAVPAEWTVGSNFKVEVYLDNVAAAPDETSDDAEIPVTPGQDDYLLRVWLTTSSHFQVVGRAERPLIVSRDQVRSGMAEFQVQCVAIPGEKEEATLVASLKYEGRPCGRVTRVLKPGGVRRKAAAADPIRIRTNDRPVDLTVQITKAGNGISYEVEVISPLLPSLVNGTRGPWPLADAAKWVTQCFNDFAAPNLPPISRYERLGGGGRELFDGAPEVFKQAFWNLMSRPETAVKLKSILVLSDEPYVPWELMIPSDGPPGTRELGMLGMEFAVGRWIRGAGQPPDQQVKLDRSLVVAPTYEGKSSLKLQMAEDEVRQILETIPGAPLRPVDQDILRSQFPGSTANLVHFVCHGKSMTDGPQALTLDDGRLSTRQLRGMDSARQFFSKQTPVVFLNACEVGRTQAALTGTDGFAPLFIKLGASAVIAPLWAVDDGVAHTIATEFYTRLKQQKSIRPAEVLAEMRARAFQGDTKGTDTYAAYCFYGDPLTTVELSDAAASTHAT